MHELQSKHIKLKNEDVEKLLEEFNVSFSQLPKISIEDRGIPEGCELGDVVLIERKFDGVIEKYYRVVS